MRIVLEWRMADDDDARLERLGVEVEVHIATVEARLAAMGIFMCDQDECPGHTQPNVTCR